MHTVLEALLATTGEAADKPAFADAELALSRRQFANATSNFAHHLKDMPDVVGILIPNGVHWAVAAVAAAMAGKTLVPLPTFFTREQMAHVVADAGIGLILTDTPPPQGNPKVTPPALVVTIDDRQPADIRLRPGFSVVTYTSGSTGTPKGVRLGSRQIGWSARALAKASGATSGDRHLSLLPLSLLLEMISAIFVPLAVEGSTFFDRDMAEAVGRGRPGSLATAFARHQPTTAVLVPQLLKIWAAELAATGSKAPSSLRFVAVGGAPVPLAVAETAIKLGIPVHEGYGLSECCSVVALNSPGQRVPGTVGRPLDGLDVTLDKGEIVVTGPSVTDGYLGRPDHKGAWHTGDLGQFDADGNLTILGRKDNLIVTSYGRNVSPEWVETVLLNDQRLMLACLSGAAEQPLTALLIPAPYAEKAVLDASTEELGEQVAQLTAQLPVYARPERVVAISLIGAKTAGLLTDNGRVRRTAVATFLKTSAPVAV